MYTSFLWGLKARKFLARRQSDHREEGVNKNGRPQPLNFHLFSVLALLFFMFLIVIYCVFVRVVCFYVLCVCDGGTVLVPLYSYSAGLCTIEGNIGTIAAIGTTPHAATTGCSHLCQGISQTR